MRSSVLKAMPDASPPRANTRDSSWFPAWCPCLQAHVCDCPSPPAACHSQQPICRGYTNIITIFSASITSTTPTVWKTPANCSWTTTSFGQVKMLKCTRVVPFHIRWAQCPCYFSAAPWVQLTSDERLPSQKKQCTQIGFCFLILVIVFFKSSILQTTLIFKLVLKNKN